MNPNESYTMMLNLGDDEDRARRRAEDLEWAGQSSNIVNLDQNHRVLANVAPLHCGVTSFISFKHLADLLAQTGQGMINPNKEYIRQLRIDDQGIHFSIESK